MCVYIRLYIYVQLYDIHIYIYIYIYIRRPLKSVERVGLHLQGPKQAASQPGSQAARQQGSKDLAVDSSIWQLADYSKVPNKRSLPNKP